MRSSHMKKHSPPSQRFWTPILSGWLVILLHISTAWAQPTSKPTTPNAHLDQGRVFVNIDTIKQWLKKKTLPTAPQTHVLSAKYVGNISKKLLTLDGTLIVRGNSQKWSRFVLSRKEALISKVIINGQKVAPLKDSRGFWVPLSKGRYEIRYRYQVKHSQLQGEHVAPLLLPKVPSANIELSLPGKGWEFQTSPSSSIKTTTQKNTTNVNMYLPSERPIVLRWKGQLIERKEQTRMRVRTQTLLNLREGLLFGKSKVSIQLLTGSIRSFQFRMPVNVELLHIGGHGVAEWFETKRTKTRRHITVQFSRAIRKKQDIEVKFERSKLPTKKSISLPFPQAPGAEQYAAFVGVLAQADTEVTHASASKAQQVDVRSLSQSIRSQSNRPILLGYECTDQQGEIKVKVTKHPWLKVLSTVINRARFETIRTREGREMTKATYWVTNNRRQFMPVYMPQSAKLLGAFVAGQPIQPAKKGLSKKQVIYLFPLARSQGKRSKQMFPVEILYTIPRKRLGAWGTFVSKLPSTPLEVLYFDWYYYFPRSHRPIWFEGTVKTPWSTRFLRRLEKRLMEDWRAGTPYVSAGGWSRKKYNVYDGRGLKERFSNDSISTVSKARRKAYRSRFNQFSRQLRASLPLIGRSLRFRGHLLKGTSPTVGISYLQHEWSVTWFWFVLALTILLLFLAFVALFHKGGIQWHFIVLSILGWIGLFVVGYFLPLTYLAGFRGLLFGAWALCLYGVFFPRQEVIDNFPVYLGWMRWWSAFLTFMLLLFDGVGMQISLFFMGVPIYPLFFTKQFQALSKETSVEENNSPATLEADLAPDDEEAEEDDEQLEEEGEK